jgi:hypothetical protein
VVNGDETMNHHVLDVALEDGNLLIWGNRQDGHCERWDLATNSKFRTGFGMIGTDFTEPLERSFVNKSGGGELGSRCDLCDQPV